MRKWRILGIVLVAFIVGVVGCPETQQMMKPIVTEPADTVVVGEVKEDPEEKPAEPEMVEQEETPATEQPTEEATDPTPPADTTPPAVVEVAWYSDSQRTEPLTADSMVRPGDTVYTVVVFSESVRHVVADDNTSRPALLIIVDGKTRRYRMLPHGADLQSGEAKPLHGDTTDYLCKYTIPADTVGTLALRVGSATADNTGNTVTKALEHIAPFTVTEPEPEQITLTLPPGYTLPSELVPTEETVLSAVEQSLIEVDQKLSWDGTSVRRCTTDSPADMISLLPYKDREEVYELFVASIDLPNFAEAAQKMKKINIELKTLWAERRITGDPNPYFTFLEKAEREQGLHRISSPMLEEIYFEENPEDLPHEDSNSRYWMILEWYRLQLAHPEINIDFQLFDLLDLYRESCRKGNIFGLDNPWG